MLRSANVVGDDFDRTDVDSMYWLEDVLLALEGFQDRVYRPEHRLRASSNGDKV